MAPYIFKEHNGIHVIDLHKTIAKADEAAAALKQIAKSGKKILFVATKKQAKDIVAEIVKPVDMPFVTERWPGGMLTNFATIRKAVKKMNNLDQLMTSKEFNNISKRERLQVQRERAKLDKNLGSIADLNRLPAALFIIDINKEHIAVAEARRLSIPTFALVDTNCNPDAVDFAIPANDDASKSIAVILQYMVESIQEGLNERIANKDKAEEEAKAEEETTEVRAEEETSEEKPVKKAKAESKVKKVKDVAESAATEGEAEAKPKRPRRTTKKTTEE